MELDVTSNSTCLFVSGLNINRLGIIRSTVASFSALSCLVGIGLTLVLKLWNRFTNRLSLYLMILAFFYSFLTAFQWVAARTLDDQPGSREGCSTVAFLVQYSSWSLLLFIFLLTLNLFLTIFMERELNFRNWEIVIVLISILFPMLFAWIPFVHNYYGLSGIWCWIRSHDDMNCSVVATGVAEQIILWYIPLTVLLVISITLIVMIFVKYLHYKSFKSLQPPELYQRALKEYSPLLVYPIIFFLLNLVALSSRIAAIVQLFPLGLLYVHAIIDPCWGLVASSAAIAYILLKNNSCKSGNRKWTLNNVDVSPLI